MDPKLKAMLDLIGWSEGTSTSPITRNDGYDVIVTGANGPSIFTDYSDHPFANGGSVLVRNGPPPLYSTAAGRYQLLARYWRVYRVQLNLREYLPASQDVVALQQLKERGADVKLLAGDVQGAIEALSNIWASFPGNNYNQGGKSMDALIAQYARFLELVP